MEMPNNAQKMKTEKIRVSIETASCTIVGTVHTPAMSYRSRLSDLLNQKEVTFLSVTDAAVYRLDDMEEPAYSTPYLAVNLNSIEVVRPLEG
jgi:hypothetical protein